MTQVLITGANRGIGLEFARRLLERGDRVVATCRHPGRALELTRLAGNHPGRLQVLALDVASARSIADLAGEIEMLDLRIDVLIHNAGVLVEGEHFGAIEAKALEQTFATNVIGPLLLTQALAPRLADAGKVIVLASKLGSISACERFGTPSYAISKAALNMTARQLGHALAERRIAVLALSPGWVRTSMGGAQATIEVDESVQRMLEVIDKLEFDAQAIGRFVSHEGEVLDW